MIKWLINFGGPIWRSLRKADIDRQAVFALLTDHGVSDEEAVDADGWCDIACVGETYNGSSFTISIIEED